MLNCWLYCKVKRKGEKAHVVLIFSLKLMYCYWINTIFHRHIAVRRTRLWSKIPKDPWLTFPLQCFSAVSIFKGASFHLRRDYFFIFRFYLAVLFLWSSNWCERCDEHFTILAASSQSVRVEREWNGFNKICMFNCLDFFYVTPSWD